MYILTAWVAEVEAVEIQLRGHLPDLFKHKLALRFANQGIIMSFALIQKVNNEQRKASVIDARSGDTVRVHQKIKEGNKERIQVFEGTVIRVDRKQSHTARITVRKIASGVGVEKSFLLHSPLVEKIEVVRRSKVRRNYLSYLRNRSGKSARLKGVGFDREAVNDVAAGEAPAEEVEPAAVETETEASPAEAVSTETE